MVKQRDILIESTEGFETDLLSLTETDRSMAVQEINICVGQLKRGRENLYDQLATLSLGSELTDYDSSLYVFSISQQLRVILSIDEDPIFDQVIVTLYRVVGSDEVEQAYQDVATVLYQDLVHGIRDLIQTI